MITRWHRWQVPWHDLWTHLESHSSHSVRCIKDNTIAPKSTYTFLPADFLLSHRTDNTCLCKIHHLEQICTCLSLTGVMSFNPYYNIKSTILLVTAITANTRIGLCCLSIVQLCYSGVMKTCIIAPFCSMFLLSCVLEVFIYASVKVCMIRSIQPSPWMAHSIYSK